MASIRARRSFALDQVDPGPVDRRDIERMLEAANWAPNHRHTEPWRFAVYSGEARRTLGAAFVEAYCQLHPPGSEGHSSRRRASLGERVWKAPVWIALGMKIDPRMPEWEELVATGCAVHNAWLMASAQRLACKWTSGAAVTHAHVADIVGFAAHTRLLGFLYVGKPAVAWPEGQRRSVTDKVRWVEG